MSKRKQSTLRLWLLTMAILLLAGGRGRVRAETADPAVKHHHRHRMATMAVAPMAPAPEVTGRTLDELQGEMSNLRQQSTDNSSEVKKLEQAITVAEPTPPAQPQTIGQHVGAVEKDVADIKKNLSDNLGIHVHGLVDTTYTYNVNNPVNKLNQLREFDQDSNSFDFQQAELHIDRTMDGGVGFVLDLNFGKTAEVLWATTRYTNSTSPQTTQEFDPTQAYLTYTIPVGKGINVQAGKFVTLLGEEVIDTYSNTNFNISRGLLFTFGIPLTHTGLQANYQLTDKLGITFGVNNGWDDVSDNNDGKTIIGELSYNPFDSLSLVFNGIYGAEQGATQGSGASKRGVIDPIITYRTPIKGLQLVGEYIYGHEDGPITNITGDVPLTPALQSPYTNSLTVPITNGVDWQSFAGYLVYDLNENWEFATRGEWFRDSDGSRTGLRQTLGEVTETINYKVPMVSGLLVRAEYRHDESGAHPFFSNETIQTTGPFAGAPAHTYAGQDTLEAAAVYTF